MLSSAHDDRDNTLHIRLVHIPLKPPTESGKDDAEILYTHRYCNALAGEDWEDMADIMKPPMRKPPWSAQMVLHWIEHQTNSRRCDK